MKKLTSVFLAITTSLSLFSTFGCSGEEEALKTEANPKQIVLADFESWAPSFQMMTVYDHFGRVTQNKDTNFVKSGKASAKLQPLGARYTESKPKVFLPFSSEKLGYDYGDITGFKEVSAQFYNDTLEPITIQMGLSSTYSYSSTATLAGDTVVLQPKAWTRASYVIDCAFLNILTDVENVAGVFFEFPDTGAETVAEAPTIYLDDVIISKADQKADAESDFDLTTDGKSYIEIMDFEKPYQKYALTHTANDSSGSVNVVKASTYGIEASSGEYMLSVLRYNQNNNEIQVIIPETQLKASGIPDVPADYWHKVYFCFDFYNYTGYTNSLQYHYIWKHKSGGRESMVPSRWLDADKDGVYKIEDRYGNPNYYALPVPGYNSAKKTGEWNTWKISLYELSLNYGGKIDSDFITDIGKLEVCFPSTKTGQNWEVFLDNFRLELGEPLVGFGA